MSRNEQTTTNKKKILLVGLGRWGANHLRVLLSLPVDLFVVDLAPANLKKASAAGVPADRLGSEPERFIPLIDAAVVVTPGPSHFVLCRDLLAAGKDVFVEKPITMTASEALQLTELAKKDARVLQVGHIFRFDTATHWLREAIRAGTFGRINILRSIFGGFKRPRQDHGVLFADAIHFVDLFNYLLDATPSSVSANMHDFLGRGMDDAISLSLNYSLPQGQVWATVEANYFLPNKCRELTVVGTDLSAICDFNLSQYKITTFQNRHQPGPDGWRAEEGIRQQIECPPEEPLLAELRAFLESVESRRSPSADGWAGYHSVRILEAAQQAAVSGQTVSLSN